jgi:hypothetical protein
LTSNSVFQSRIRLFISVSRSVNSSTVRPLSRSRTVSCSAC